MKTWRRLESQVKEALHRSRICLRVYIYIYIYNILYIARRDHELDSINKLLENYKKEKTYMSKKLEKECGYERLILMEKEILDLEGQLSKLTKEKKVLKREVEKSEQEISKAQLKEMATKGNKITESISPEETRINKQTKNALQKQFRLEKKLNEIEINDMHIEKHIKELKYKTKIEEKKAAVRGKRNYESDVSKSATVRNESRIDVSETDVEEVKEENLELKNEFEDWKRESETEILSWKRRVGDIKKKKEDFNKVYTANLHRLGELRKLYIIESQKERRAQSVIGNPITPVPDSETRRVNDIREARAKYSRMKFKARSPSPHSKKSEAPAREETINNPKATESREKTVTPNEVHTHIYIYIYIYI